MKHIKSSLLFGAADGRADLEKTEREHLANCEACTEVLAVYKTYIAEDTAGKKRGEEGSRTKTVSTC